MPSDAQALTALAELLGSGGGLVLLGWLVARVGPALKALRSLAAVQSELATAQLKALGEHPEKVPEQRRSLGEDVHEIRKILVANSAA